VYSKRIAKTKNDFPRFVFFLLALGLIIAIPGGVVALMFQMADFEMTTIHRFILFMVWLIPVWVFIFRNWKLLNKRLSNIPK